MKEVLSSPLFGIVLSIFAYEVGLYLNKKTGTPLCNPLLVAVALIIAVLQIFHIPLEYYQQGGDVIAIFWPLPQRRWPCRSTARSNNCSATCCPLWPAVWWAPAPRWAASFCCAACSGWMRP